MHPGSCCTHARTTHRYQRPLHMQHHAPLVEMLRIAIAQSSRVASDVDDASADTSAGSAPAATTAPRCAAARRSTRSVQNTMHATARSCADDHARTAARATTHASTQLEPNTTCPSPCRQHHAPLTAMMLIASAHSSRVASDVDDASADTSAGSAPAATTAPRCASVRRSTKSVQNTMHATARSCADDHARTAARATTHASVQLQPCATRANQQHRAPLIEMFLIAIPQYSRVASIVDDASADTSLGSAPAATTAPHCASARRSTKLVQSTQRLFQCVTAAAVSKHQTQTSQRCN